MYQEGSDVGISGLPATGYPLLAPMNTKTRLVAYNLGQGGSKDPALWQRLLPDLAPDLFFVQESRDPASSWLTALPATQPGSLLWTSVPGGRWGSGLWVRSGKLIPLEVPGDFAGRVVAAAIEGLAWPGVGIMPVVAMSIHAPTRKGSSYIKEVERILDFASTLAEGRPLIMAGDFNVAVGLRDPGLPLYNTRGERAILRRLREELDLVACWQTAHPGEPLARTLRWMRKSDSLPYHCDGIFVPAEWTSALHGCDVLEAEEWCALSDHNPVIATLAFDNP